MSSISSHHFLGLPPLIGFNRVILLFLWVFFLLYIRTIIIQVPLLLCLLGLVLLISAHIYSYFTFICYIKVKYPLFILYFIRIFLSLLLAFLFITVISIGYGITSLIRVVDSVSCFLLNICSLLHV